MAYSYHRNFTLGMLAYAVVLIVCLQFLKAHPESAWRVPTALAPVAPIAFVVANVIRHIRRLDEFQQRKNLEVLAFAYPTMLIGSISVGFLEHAGLPQANWIYVGVCMFALLGVGQLITWWRYR